MLDKPVITRFPPSPTGFLHIGRARTALFDYLFAKQNGGKMIFRFENTDKTRSKKEFEDAMIDSLKWLGISWDNKVIERQADRTDIYRRYLHKLVDEDKAYISKETIDDGEKKGQENEVVRFRNPNKKITFTDLIRGDITIDTTDLEDFIIARNINDPLYHLAVVVDDFEMGITHVIRGDDGISNTPRQILIQQGIGAPQPVYVHLPLVLAPDKSKLSGRHGAISVTDYRNKGYLPEAIINFLALLGWNPGTNQEIFSMDELIKTFDIRKIQKSGAVFNVEKLDWLNRQYMMKLSDADFTDHAKVFIPEWLVTSGTLFKRLLPLLREKISNFGEIPALLSKTSINDNAGKSSGGAGELSFVHTISDYPTELLLWKKAPDAAKAKIHLTKAKESFRDITNADFNAEALKNSLWSYAEANGKGDVLWPLRVAITGKEKSPDPFNSAAVLGKEETIHRIDSALKKLS